MAASSSSAPPPLPPIEPTDLPLPMTVMEPRSVPKPDAVDEKTQDILENIVEGKQTLPDLYTYRDSLAGFFLSLSLSFVENNGVADKNAYEETLRNYIWYLCKNEQSKPRLFRELMWLWIETLDPFSKCEIATRKFILIATFSELLPEWAKPLIGLMVYLFTLPFITPCTENQRLVISMMFQKTSFKGTGADPMDVIKETQFIGPRLNVRLPDRIRNIPVLYNNAECQDYDLIKSLWDSTSAYELIANFMHAKPDVIKLAYFFVSLLKDCIANADKRELVASELARYVEEYKYPIENHETAIQNVVVVIEAMITEFQFDFYKAFGIDSIKERGNLPKVFDGFRRGCIKWIYSPKQFAKSPIDLVLENLKRFQNVIKMDIFPTIEKEKPTSDFYPTFIEKLESGYYILQNKFKPSAAAAAAAAEPVRMKEPEVNLCCYCKKKASIFKCASCYKKEFGYCSREHAKLHWDEKHHEECHAKYHNGLMQE